MKTYLTYGFGVALAGALLNLALYFMGYHSDPAKINSAGWISSLLMLGVCVAGIVLGTQARRAEVPATEEFGYGRALGAGVMIMLFAGLFGIVTNYLYFQVINPGFMEATIQAQNAKFEAKGMNSTQIEQATEMMRKMMTPAIMSAFAFLGAMFWGTIISLITAAFLKRSASDEPPVVA